MILNTRLKNLGHNLSKKTKMFLGINISRSFKTRYPDIVIKKVKINEENEIMQVFDYPKEFLCSSKTNKIINKFLLNKKNNAD